MDADQVRGFVRSDLAWYAAAAEVFNPEVVFGLFDRETAGQTGTQARVVWEKLAIDEPASAQLQVWDDAFSLLSLLPEVMNGLQLGEAATSDRFVDYLLAQGFVDFTAYVRPGSSILEVG